MEATICWLFVRHHLLNPEHEYLLAGDETVVTKAGKQTYGFDRFFSSLYGKPVPGVAFFAFSLVSVQEQDSSYPLLVEQRVRSAEEKQAARKKAKGKERAQGMSKHGRPKGGKSKDKTQVEWTPELRYVQGLLQKVMNLVTGFCSVSYLVLDGHFGNNNVLRMVLQSTSLHLVSKLRNNAVLYFVYDGPQKQFGPRRRYGAKKSTIRPSRASIEWPPLKSRRFRPTSTRRPCCTNALRRH